MPRIFILSWIDTEAAVSTNSMYLKTSPCPGLLLTRPEVVIMQEFSFSTFYRKISVRDVAFAICGKHMADIVRSGEQVFVTHAARLPHLWRWQHAENSLLGRPVVACFCSPPYSIAPANYGKFWSILPYYAPFLGPRGTTWFPSSEDNFARIRYSQISDFSYPLWNNCLRMLCMRDSFH